MSQGYGVILSYPYYGDTVGTINAGMLVRQETIDRHPDLVMDMVRTHARATAYLQAHPDQWLEKAATFGTDPKVLRAASASVARRALSAARALSGGGSSGSSRFLHER